MCVTAREMTSITLYQIGASKHFTFLHCPTILLIPPLLSSSTSVTFSWCVLSLFLHFFSCTSRVCYFLSHSIRLKLKSSCIFCQSPVCLPRQFKKVSRTTLGIKLFTLNNVHFRNSYRDSRTCRSVVLIADDVHLWKTNVVICDPCVYSLRLQ